MRWAEWGGDWCSEEGGQDPQRARHQLHLPNPNIFPMTDPPDPPPQVNADLYQCYTWHRSKLIYGQQNLQWGKEIDIPLASAETLLQSSADAMFLPLQHCSATHCITATHGIHMRRESRSRSQHVERKLDIFAPDIALIRIMHMGTHAV